MTLIKTAYYIPRGSQKITSFYEFYCFVTWFLNDPISKPYIFITVSSIVIKFAGYEYIG